MLRRRVPTMKAHPDLLPGDSHFPGVTELARRVLPCPPSTGPEERIFSVCGQVENGKKYRLSDVSLAMLTMLRKTWDIV
jgi:hypothetical protein